MARIDPKQQRPTSTEALRQTAQAGDRGQTVAHDGPTVQPDAFSGDGHAVPLPGPVPADVATTSPLGARLTALRGMPRLPVRASARLDEVNRLLAAPTERTEEARLLALFTQTTPAELNHLVAEVDLDRLLEAMDDRWFGPDNHKAILRLLTQTRVADLTTLNRARLVNALQSGPTPHQAEHAIENLFRATRGAELTVLKNAVDAGDDHHDLVQLLHADIDSYFIRHHIIDHITGDTSVPSTGRCKVLSDIDDTFYVNLKDESFPKKTVYTGVRAFYRELAAVPAEHAEYEPVVNFLTARPTDRAGLLEDKTLEDLRDHGINRATVLAGDIFHVVGNEELAEKKRENFDKFSQVYPEYRFVFIGDSGQGDAMLAENLEATVRERVPATFIHNVTGMSAAERARYADHGVTVFDSYAGAALAAHKAGLLDLPALARVATASVADFDAIDFSDPDQRLARRSELVHDLGEINALLPAAERVRLPRD